MNKTVPYCQGQNCSPLNVLYRDIDYVNIAGRSSSSGLQSEYTVGENGDFELQCAKISRKR